MIEKLKLKYQTKKMLIHNFIALAILQGSNYILPLITIPYLTRVLGIKLYGLTVFATAFTSYFSMLTDYGFNLSATREIAKNRNDKNKISTIFSSVMIIKLILLLVSFLILIIAITFIDKFNKYWMVYLFSFGTVIGMTIFPEWLFLGMEKMKLITYINLIGKTISTFAIFIFIKEKSDYVIVPIINSISFLIIGLLSLVIVKRYLSVELKVPTKQQLLYSLKDSTQYFTSRISASIYSVSNTFVLGLVTSTTVVGYYTIAEKIYRAVLGLYKPAVDVLYPFFSKEKNINLFKKIFYLCTFLNFLLMIVIYFFAGEIVYLVAGENLIESVYTLKVFTVILLITGPSYLIGYPLLAAFGFPKYANYSIVLGSIFHLIGLIILLIFSKVSIHLIIYLVLITEAIVFYIRIKGIKRNNIWEKKSKNDILVLQKGK